MKAVCIKCHDADAVVTMDVDGTCLFHCGGCDEDFTPDDVRAHLKAQQDMWVPLLKWVDAYPKD